MNPPVAKIDFPALAKKNIQSLSVVEREIFDVNVDVDEEKIVPIQPKYWDINPGGTVPVYLRAGI